MNTTERLRKILRKDDSIKPEKMLMPPNPVCNCCGKHITEINTYTGKNWHIEKHHSRPKKFICWSAFDGSTCLKCKIDVTYHWYDTLDEIEKELMLDELLGNDINHYEFRKLSEPVLNGKYYRKYKCSKRDIIRNIEKMRARGFE